MQELETVFAQSTKTSVLFMECTQKMIAFIISYHLFLILFNFYSDYPFPPLLLTLLMPPALFMFCTSQLIPYKGIYSQLSIWIAWLWVQPTVEQNIWKTVTSELNIYRLLSCVFLNSVTALYIALILY